MAISFYICGALTLLFSALCFVPAGDIALSGFAIALVSGVLLFFLSLRFLGKSDRSSLAPLRKFLEYLPFILFASFILRRAGDVETNFILDLATVLCWLAVTGFAFWILFHLSDKRIEVSFPGFSAPAHSKKTVLMHTFEWVDALLQAACLVLLINLFLFQLYAIPSESMVPEFMVGDRVFVVKTPSGPKFPLSDVGIPRMRDYDRGDIIVFNNPHYNDTKEARIRSFTSQLVYMLTFTYVNINRDEFGEEKADPLVKRITGLPGEKLMMVDGVLYSRTSLNTEWAPVPEDATWATWNLSALPRSELALVKDKGMTKEEFMLLESIESMRANLDIEAATKEAESLVRRFAALRKAPDTVSSANDLIPESRRELYTLFNSNDEITRTLLTTNGGYIWFRDFMTGWKSSTGYLNLYEERSRNMNIMLKLSFGRLIVRNAELIAANNTEAVFKADTQRREYLSEASSYIFYMSQHDQRNLFEFPAGEKSFIPEDNYFMMGDNRFNSLDMRHSYVKTLVAIDPRDALSFRYRSNLEPQFVPVSRILGSATFRFWPISRAGIPR